jgi:hypothetical protein
MKSSAQRFTGPASPLRGVHRDAWRAFYTALEAQAANEVSESGGLGAFDIRPRRLVELGYATGLRPMRTEKGRSIQTCEFILPWTQARFLGNPFAQYTALAQSMRLYYEALREGKIVKPSDVSMAGALAVLHKGGKGALGALPEMFAATRVLFDKVNKIF